MDNKAQSYRTISSEHKFNLYDNIMNDVYQCQLEKDLMTFKQTANIYQDIVTKGKQKIDEQFHQRKKVINAQKRIHRSSLINKSHMLKAQLRHKMCQQIFQAVLHRINQKINSDEQQHSILLIKLIVQGALRMFEPELHIRCLPKHLQIVERVLQASQQTFNSVMKQQTGRQYPIKLKINNKDILNERNIQNQDPKQFTKKKEDQQCIGGVILSDPTGNITYKNTIDARINILRQISLPMMRACLWPAQNQQQAQRQH